MPCKLTAAKATQGEGVLHHQGTAQDDDHCEQNDDGDGDDDDGDDDDGDDDDDDDDDDDGDDDDRDDDD